MPKTDLGLCATIVALLITIFVGGYHFGRKYERKFWAHAIPEALEKTCLECAGIHVRQQ